MDIIARRLEREYPQTNEARSIDVAPLRELTNSGDGVNGGDGRSKTGRPERRGPERCLWNAQGKQDFPVLDFSGSATTAPCKGENSSPEENATRRINGWRLDVGSKMEIPANIRGVIHYRLAGSESERRFQMKTIMCCLALVALAVFTSAAFAQEPTLTSVEAKFDTTTDNKDQQTKLDVYVKTSDGMKSPSPKAMKAVGTRILPTPSRYKSRAARRKEKSRTAALS